MALDLLAWKLLACASSFALLVLCAWVVVLQRRLASTMCAVRSWRRYYQADRNGVHVACFCSPDDRAKQGCRCGAEVGR